MKHAKRILAALVAALTVTALAIPCILPASALPDYKPSEGYAASKFYAALKAYNLTGDQRGDTVAVALTQLGYHEGNSELDFDGLNTSGEKNFVEYNRIYGKVDNGEGNGVSYGYAWCAAFVSYCLRAAGVAESAAVIEISCSRMVNWYRSVKGRAAWQEKTYTPQTGDVIFFKTGTGNSVSTHVGFVVGIKDGNIYTVEGNSGGVVGMHKYAADNSTIVGYGIPDYGGTPAASYSFTLEALDERLGVYYTTAGSGLNFRSTPGTSGQKLTDPLPYGTRVEITEIRDGWGKTVYSGKTGWISMSYVMHEDDLVYSVYYKSKWGKVPLPARKKPGETVKVSDVVPEEPGYIFVGWVNEEVSDDVAFRPGDSYSADATIELTAKFERAEYSVVFKNEDGKLLSSGTYYWGDKLRLPEEPVKPDDGEFRYTFIGWDRDLAERVTEDATYTARYEKTALQKPADTSGAKDGCGSSVSLLILAIAAVCGAVILIKKKKTAF